MQKNTGSASTHRTVPPHLPSGGANCAFTSNFTCDPTMDAQQDRCEGEGCGGREGWQCERPQAAIDGLPRLLCPFLTAHRRPSWRGGKRKKPDHHRRKKSSSSSIICSRRGSLRRNSSNSSSSKSSALVSCHIACHRRWSAMGKNCMRAFRGLCRVAAAAQAYLCDISANQPETGVDGRVPQIGKERRQVVRVPR